MVVIDGTSVLVVVARCFRFITRCPFEYFCITEYWVLTQNLSGSFAKIVTLHSLYHTSSISYFYISKVRDYAVSRISTLL